MNDPKQYAQHTPTHSEKPPVYVLLDSFAKLANGDPKCLDIGDTITAQMGLFMQCYEGIRSGWIIKGKHRAGGVLLVLDPTKTRENGNLFAVSYNLRDDYTITYAKTEANWPESRPVKVQIIMESEEIYCDQLCEVFTNTTRIIIPAVQFG